MCDGVAPFTMHVSYYFFLISLSFRSNRMEERGSPCLIPLWFLKGGVGEPSSIRIENEAEFLTILTILQNRIEKPMASRVDIMESHLIGLTIGGLVCGCSVRE